MWCHSIVLPVHEQGPRIAVGITEIIATGHRRKTRFVLLEVRDIERRLSRRLFEVQNAFVVNSVQDGSEDVNVRVTVLLSPGGRLEETKTRSWRDERSLSH